MDALTMRAINAHSKTTHPEAPTLFLEFGGSEGQVREQGAALGSMVVAIEVTEQVQGRLKLEGLRAEAEAANRAKDQFLAILGHELRNPLAPILSALQLLRLRGVEAGERERAG